MTNRTRRSHIIAAVLITLTAGCTQPSTDTASDDARIAELEARVSALEADLDNAADQLGAHSEDSSASRLLGEQTTTATTQEQVDDVAEVTVEELQQVTELEQPDLAEFTAASFASSDFYDAPLDPEFGGIQIAGTANEVNILMQGVSLSEVERIATLLEALGSPSDLTAQATQIESSGSHDVQDSGVQIRWENTDNEVSVTLTR